MSNTIKLKRGTGSDPSASDLVVGEVALRTDSGKLFTKKDDNSVVQIGGGAGAIDDDAVTTAKIADDAVTYAKIQNVSATNRILGRDSSGAGVIEEITPANLRTMLNVEDGATADQTASEIVSLLSDQDISTTGTVEITSDQTNPALLIRGNGPNFLRFLDTGGASDSIDVTFRTSSHRLQFEQSSDASVIFSLDVDDNQATFTGNVDVGSGLDVTGNVNATGDLTITSSLPKISLTDSGDNPDYEITNTNGSLNFKDTTNDATRISIQSSATTIANNLDCGAGIDVTGNITATGSVTSTGLIMGDNKSILLGASDDFRIRHTGSHSEITDEGTGNLRLGSNQVIIGSPTFDETSAKFVDDGAVELYYDNSKKFETTTGGAKVTGNFITASGDILLDTDSHKLKIGLGEDLELYHTGTNSVIQNDTGVLYISGDDVRIVNNAINESGLKFTANGAVELYHNNSKKFETSSAGATITGDLTITDDLFLQDNLYMGDTDTLIFGDDEDLFIKHDGTHNFIQTNNGKQLIIYGSGEDLAKFIDDGAVELYYNGSKKFETTSGGATVTGTLSISGDASVGDLIQIGDDVKIEDYNAANSFRVKGVQDGNKGFIAFGSQTKQLGCNGSSAALTYDGNEVLTSASTVTATNVVGVANTGNSEYRVPFLSADTGTAAVYTDTNSGMTYNPSSNTLSAVTFNGALSGNASSATQLANARTIAGTSFNGTANIDISYNNLTNKPTIPTNNNQLSNGAGYITSVSGQNYNSLSNLPTIPSNNNQLSNGAGYITSVSGQNYNLLSNRPTIPTNNNQLSNGAGYITSGSDRACRAWVNFRGNSSVTRNDHANVSSVSDNGVGHYTVSFSSSMPNSSYCVTVGFMDDAGNSNVAKIVDNSLGTGSFQIRTGSFQDGSGNTDRDFDGVFCAVFAG